MKTLTVNDMWLDLYSRHIAEKSEEPMPLPGSLEYDEGKSMFFQAVNTFIFNVIKTVSENKLDPPDLINLLVNLNHESCDFLDELRVKYGKTN